MCVIAVRKTILKIKIEVEEFDEPINFTFPKDDKFIYLYLSSVGNVKSDGPTSQ